MEFSDEFPTAESRIAHCREVLAGLTDEDKAHHPQKVAIYEQAIREEEAKLPPAQGEQHA